MARYNVEHNGKWACFSTVVDNYITPFRPLFLHELWRKMQYGIHCGTVHDSNIMSYEEAEETIKWRAGE